MHKTMRHRSMGLTFAPYYIKCLASHSCLLKVLCTIPILFFLCFINNIIHPAVDTNYKVRKVYRGFLSNQMIAEVESQSDRLQLDI